MLDCVKLGKFEKLTHLKIVKNDTNPELAISASTKFLHFENYIFARMPTFENFQFEVMELIDCMNVDWFAELLTKDETQVKNLSIKDLELSSETFMVMLEYKVTNFKSKNIKFLGTLHQWTSRHSLAN